MRDARVLVAMPAALILCFTRRLDGSAHGSERGHTGFPIGGDLLATIGWKLNGPPLRAAPLLRAEPGGVDRSGDDEKAFGGNELTNGDSKDGSNVEDVGVGRPSMPRPAAKEFEREWGSGGVMRGNKTESAMVGWAPGWVGLRRGRCRGEGRIKDRGGGGEEKEQENVESEDEEDEDEKREENERPSGSDLEISLYHLDGRFRLITAKPFPCRRRNVVSRRDR